MEPPKVKKLTGIQELREKKDGLVTLKERIDTRQDNPYSNLFVSIFLLLLNLKEK